MSIKQNGGVFGRNPTFNDVTIEGDLIINGEVFTGLDFQGSWNASTNSPALASSVGTNGEFYIVSVAGTTDLNGITNWGIGDWAIFNGTAWQRVEGGADGNFNDVTVAGTLEVTGEITANGGIALGDNDKATFGVSDDLQIFHDGSNSFITEAGTGSLKIRSDGSGVLIQGSNGDNLIFADVGDDVVKLFADGGNTKLATTSTGIDVTGTATMDGLTVENSLSGATNLFNFQNTSNTANSNSRLKISTGGTSGGDPILQLTDNASNWYVFGDQSDSFKFKIGTSVTDNKFVIDPSGNVLVGKTATDINVAGVELGARVESTISGSYALRLNRLGSDGDIAHFRKTGASVGSISVTASATAYNTSSDYRLKEDDVPMTGATERVKALRPINFAWKVDGSRVDGFFAHEAQDVVPEAVHGTKDAMQDEEYEVTAAVYEDVTTPAVEAVLDEDGAVITEAVEETTESVLVSEAVMGTRSVPDYQGIDQSKLVPLLTAALQEAITKIEALTTRIETLEGQ